MHSSAKAAKPCSPYNVYPHNIYTLECIKHIIMACADKTLLPLYHAKLFNTAIIIKVLRKISVNKTYYYYYYYKVISLSTGIIAIIVET